MAGLVPATPITLAQCLKSGVAGTSPATTPCLIPGSRNLKAPPMTAADIPSVANRARLVAAGAPVVGACFLETKAVFVLGDAALLFVADSGEPHRFDVHAGGILAAVGDGERIVTAGDDGKIVATAADLTTTTVATDPKHRWIDHVAIAPDGSIAWSAGKEAYVQPRKGDGPRMIVAPSTVGGIAFAPKGLRAAIAHYNGVTLWFPNAVDAAPEQLAWKGSHLDVTFSPDGRYVVTAMQEPSLHGWRLADGKSMRMSGYSAKVRAMAWTADGKWLATSGAPQLIVWPFGGKNGPMGKQPLMLASAENKVSAVACHPSSDVIAAGYDDGVILLVRMGDGAEILARDPGGSPVSTLAWNAAGTLLAFGTEEGDAGIVDLA
jgi:WD40 repeat protein